MHVAGDGIELSGLIGLALVVNVAFFLFAAGMMTRMRTLQAAPAMQLPVFLILMTAPVYVPRDLLQGWIETVEGQPMTASSSPAAASWRATRSTSSSRSPPPRAAPRSSPYSRAAACARRRRRDDRPRPPGGRLSRAYRD